MALTGANIESVLRKIGALGKQMKPLDDLAKGANEALKQAPPDITPKGAAAFLATLAQESAWFRTAEEYDKNAPYKPYIGRTFQQVTHPGNYKAFGKWCQERDLLTDPNQFFNHPDSLADYKWAWLGGIWYFEHAKLWSHANSGNFFEVSQGVNLGPGK